MKKRFLVLFVLPVFAMAQVKNKPVVKKTATPKTSVAKTPAATKPANEFLILGTVTGYPDGTTVDLFNGNTGAPEGSEKLTGGKFTFKGSVPAPDFKVIAFNGAAPYITLFLDNSLVNITAKEGAVENAIVKGSPSHAEFQKFSDVVKPYEKLLAGDPAADQSLKIPAATALAGFVKQYPNAPITALAVYRHFQLTDDAEILETEFNTLPATSKASPIGAFVSRQLADNKKNPIGKPLADFSQADTSGNMISLSSLKGKYVLVDFWASWCRPCRMENPNVVNMYTKYKDKNFTVLGVSLDQAKPAWIDAINMDGLTWTHVSDLKGWSNSVARQFEILSIPQNFLLDPQGKVIAKNLRGPNLETKLASLLK